MFLLATLAFGGASSLFGDENKKGYGNLMIMAVRVYADSPGSLKTNINGDAVSIDNKDLHEYLGKTIIRPETLIIEYTSSVYSDKSQAVVKKIHALRRDSGKAEKTFFIDIGNVGGKLQSEVAFSFADESGSGIRFKDITIRNESEFGNLFKLVEKFGVKRVLWIPDESNLAAKFSSALKQNKMIILEPTKDPVFSGLKIE
jgi:hypothetical protein